MAAASGDDGAAGFAASYLRFHEVEPGDADE